MNVSHEPAHLPRSPISSKEYDRLYAFNGRADDYHEDASDWQEIRIRPGMTEKDVYRLLPSARDFEYGGYLTRSRIRFAKCGPNRANMPMSKSCTFHSHPSHLTSADCPSANDVFQFLNFRHLRAITVGATRIWVWDKTKATMTKVKKLGDWAESSLLSEVHRLEKRFPNRWRDPFMKLALKKLGLNWPKTRRDWKANWERMVRNILKIRVRIFPRDPGVKP